jgi:predicted nucleic acid-binding protein
LIRVFWDSNLFIYFFEGGTEFTPLVMSLRKKMVSVGAELISCTMALGEVMTGPRAEKSEDLALLYRSSMLQSATVVPFDINAADLYATIRSQNNVSQPDGIQLACAAAHGVELFVTNDRDLQKLRIPGIHFIVSIETALTLLG